MILMRQLTRDWLRPLGAQTFRMMTLSTLISVRPAIATT
jgi:hypothetical protein